MRHYLKATLCSIVPILLVFTSCAETRYFTQSKDRTVLLNDLPRGDGWVRKNEFETKSTRVYLFWGLTPIRRATLDDLLDEETKPGDTIGNLKIRETYTGLDGLVDTILYGLVRPYTVIVTGTIYTRNQNADKIEETENEKK